MDAEESFRIIRALLTGDPAVSVGKMFGSEGLKVGGKVFAMLVKGKLVVKLPAAQIEPLIASAVAVYFDPGHGRLMKQWVAVLPSSHEDWLHLVTAAKTFVQLNG
jgi:TfoX/Sxy family transcriptional regulator of competence genes